MSRQTAYYSSKNSKISLVGDVKQNCGVVQEHWFSSVVSIDSDFRISKAKNGTILISNIL